MFCIVLIDVSQIIFLSSRISAYAAQSLHAFSKLFDDQSARKLNVQIWYYIIV